MKVDWNQNNNFDDDIPHKYWENHTEATGVLGTYYWCYIDNETDPTICRLGWWCPLRERISDFSWWKEMGRLGYLRYGFHSWHHQICGNKTVDPRADSYVMWNGQDWVMNQTWIEQKYEEARNELAYCLGDSGYGFEANKCLHSVAGAQHHNVLYNALGNLSWIYLTYHQGDQKEIGWYLCNPWQPASPSFIAGDPLPDFAMPAYKDVINTLYPYFTIIGHIYGSYDLSYTFPPYSDMFVFVHLDESFEFWFNARYLKRNTAHAYATSDKIILEYKANNTLKDYVWRFPIEFNGKYFNSFSDNRSIGKIRRIDGKYVYIEFIEGGNEKIEVTYGTTPHVYQISKYIQTITQVYTPKKLQILLWNASGAVNVMVNCTKLQKPTLITVSETPIEYHYNPANNICSFNVTLDGLKIVEIFWERAPPDPPKIVSPACMKRFDPNKSVVFAWEFNDPDVGDFQYAYRFQLSNDYRFTSIIIDTGKVITLDMQTTQHLPGMVGIFYWRVKTWDSQDNEGDWSDYQPIIVDRLFVVNKGVTAGRTDIGNTVTVYFEVKREFDGSTFDGADGLVYINQTAAVWNEQNCLWEMNVTQNSVSEWCYCVSSIIDVEFNIETINNVAGEQKIIWDQLLVTIAPSSTEVSIGTEVNFKVTATYAFDGQQVPEFTVTVLREDGKRFKTNNFSDISFTPCTHQYSTESIKEERYGLTVFTSNLPSVTWMPKPFTQLILEWISSNALVLAMFIQVTITIFVLMRERRRIKNKQPRF